MKLPKVLYTTGVPGEIVLGMATVLCVFMLSRSVSAQDHTVSDVEYEIYEMILLDRTPVDEFDCFLRSEYPDYVMPRLKLLVLSTTDNPFREYAYGFRPESVADSISVETSEQMLSDLERKARAASTIEDHFSALVPVHVISAAEMESIGGEEPYAFWEAMRESFGPCAIVRFSRVGFDGTGEYGVLYYSYSSGELSGAGYRVIVRRIESAWKVYSAAMIWIS